MNSAGKRGVFDEGSRFLKYTELRKEFEDEYMFARDIKRGWTGRRTQHRCFSIQTLIDKIVPLE